MLVNTPEAYAPAMERITRCKELIVDTETTGLRPWNGDRLVGIAVEADSEAYYFPFRHVQGNLPPEKFPDFQRELSRPDKNYVGFNYTFDMQTMIQDGVPLPAHIHEVKCQAHLMNENEPSFKLKALGDKYLGPGASQEAADLDDLLLERGLGKGHMWKLPPEQVAPYACQDVRLTRGLRDFYIPHLKTWKIYDIWQEVNEYQLIVSEIECKGMKLITPLMRQYIEEADRKVEEMRAIIEELAGYKINLNSAKQVQKWLGVASTAREFLELMPDRPGITELRAFRSWYRVNANYYRRFLEMMDANEVLHPNLNLIGTISSRLSCEKPPLQAVPKATNEIWKVKDVFGPDNDEDEIGEADYSQAELRVACHYAKETRMGDKLIRGADLHSETAQEIGIPRFAAKQLNFSVIYGVGAATLSERLHIPRSQAKSYLDKYHRNYPGFRPLYRQAEAQAASRGYIRLFTGRLRHYNTATAPTHKASSNLIQGGVAEMNRIALTRLRKELGLRILLPVHDSILFQMKRGDRSRLLPEINRIMTDTPWCSIPMKVDFKAGPTWGTAKVVEITE